MGRHEPIRNRAADWSILAWADANQAVLARSGFAACVLFFALTLAYGVVAGGHWQTIRASAAGLADGLAVSAGFEMTSVEIKGRRHMSEEDVSAALQARKGVSVFGFDTVKARNALEASGWIEDARVARVLPSTVVVELTEREPFALWREGGKLAAIAADGRLLGLVERTDYPALPILSGPGAAVPAGDVLMALKAHAGLMAMVADIERVVGRRWDLVLDSGTRIKLPARNFEPVFAGLANITAQNPGIFYEISEMDFRAPSQFTLRLKNDSAEKRQQFLSRLSVAAEGRGDVF